MKSGTCQPSHPINKKLAVFLLLLLTAIFLQGCEVTTITPPVEPESPRYYQALAIMYDTASGAALAEFALDQTIANGVGQVSLSITNLSAYCLSFPSYLLTITPASGIGTVGVDGSYYLGAFPGQTVSAQTFQYRPRIDISNVIITGSWRFC